jgi:exonuclease 3'-5' domain-containing protein 1
VQDSKKNAGRYPNRKGWGPDVFWDNEQRQAAIDAWKDGKLLDEELGGVESSDD